MASKVVTRKDEEIVPGSLARDPGGCTDMGNRDTSEFKEVDLE